MSLPEFVIHYIALRCTSHIW